MAMLASNSQLFYRRGDAWISPRQQQEDFGRDFRTENPDFDQYFCKKNKPKQPFIDPPPISQSATGGNSVLAPYKRQMAQILMASRRKPNEVICKDNAHRPVTEADAVSLHADFRAKADRLQQAKEKQMVSIYWVEEGVEQEKDFDSLDSGKAAFDRRMRRAKKKGITEIELWTYDTGELVRRWTPRPKGKGR